MSVNLFSLQEYVRGALIGITPWVVGLHPGKIYLTAERLTQSPAVLEKSQSHPWISGIMEPPKITE